MRELSRDIYIVSDDSVGIHMYREVNWAVPADPYILEELGEYDGWHTAKNLEINTDFSRQWISQRCPVFVDHELAERHEDEPAYRLTEFGEKILNGEAEYEELNDTES
ncbi:hypothetical protein [Halorubrum sp. Atlit-26R]|uniref:hypothetical protein n=1 Tax=Halorubrum sp. Atlit-26R TaxID=2282128 RepID=UPI001F3253AE|nr:hypothetical protein [Halorubrum sp. Atlit-26R]